MKFLINTTEVYRVETENEVEQIINEAKHSNMFVLVRYNCQKKEIKVKGEVIDEYYRVTLVKNFNNEKEPEAHIAVNYEVDY